MLPSTPVELQLRARQSIRSASNSSTTLWAMERRALIARASAVHACAHMASAADGFLAERSHDGVDTVVLDLRIAC
jgi:hypothetical protein